MAFLRSAIERSERVQFFDVKSMSRLDKARAFKFMTALFFSKKGWYPNFEVTVGEYAQRRADVVCIGEGIAIVEIKSSKQDFDTDHKWHEYLEMCNKFYFCSDRKTIEHIKSVVDKTPYKKRVGLIVVDLEKVGVKIVTPCRESGWVNFRNMQLTLRRCIVAGSQFFDGRYKADQSRANSFLKEPYANVRIS